MAKGNPFLGMARGSAGDFTYYRQFGEQVFRARNRHPANPQTTLQLLQRVVMQTVQRAYSMLMPIADHSFQGRPVGTLSQARFTAANIEILRRRLAYAIEEIAHGGEQSWYQEANFAAKGSYLPEFNSYVVSEGSLASLVYGWEEGRMLLSAGDTVPIATMTYQQLVSALGLQRGDQITLVMMTVDDTDTAGQFNGVQFGRFILDPSTEDGFTQPAFSPIAEGSSVYTLANPNAANEGTLYFTVVNDRLRLSFNQTPDVEPLLVTAAPAAFSLIVSRRAGDAWQRSSESLALRPYTVGTGNLDNDHGTDYLADAIESYRTQNGSTLYLNQADNV